MSNRYLEKIAGLGDIISKAKSTVGVAMGGKVNRIDSMIAKRHGIKADSKLRWQGANSVPNQAGTGINVGKNNALRKETKTQLRADKHVRKLEDMRNQAELAMHRARSTVGKAALGAGAVGAGVHALTKTRETYPQGY